MQSNYKVSVLKYYDFDHVVFKLHVNIRLPKQYEDRWDCWGIVMCDWSMIFKHVESNICYKVLSDFSEGCNQLLAEMPMFDYYVI